MATLTQVEDPRPAARSASDPLAAALYGGAGLPAAARADAGSDIGQALKSRMPDLVKGAGFVGQGGNTPLTDTTDVMNRSGQAAMDIRMTTYQGFRNKAATVNSMNPDFLRQFGALKAAITQPSPMDYINAIVARMPGGGEALKAYAAKSFTAGNLGIGSVSGLTPFNLLAPSRLIYPVCLN